MKSNLKFAVEMPSFTNETLIRDSKNLRVTSGLRAGKNKKTVEIDLPVRK